MTRGNYIIFDMEWNEIRTEDFAAQNRIGFPLSGEIIELGAVKMTSDGVPTDEFSSLVKPSFTTRMHPHVQRLTGIDWQMLVRAPSFTEMWARFRRWCGPRPLLLSWGTADRQVLGENIRLHGLPVTQIPRWYDAQRIFGRFCLDRYEQYGLARACKYMGIEMDDDAHRAVNDARYTAQICSRLPLVRGVSDYRYHGSVGPIEFRPTVAYFYFHGYKDKDSLWDDEALDRIRIGRQELALTEKENCRKNTRIALGMTADGTRYLVRWRVYTERRGRTPRFGVAREVYRTDGQLLHWYREVAARNQQRRWRFAAQGNPAFR